ncbi:MAG: hypothetical protein LBR19_07790, partial [Bifidobacteriaceae bacterium]|nr:hypothetical protein [Bifidobacteriaceae bacterium]
SPRADDLTVARSYFDHQPYWERDDAGELIYTEFQHTFEDHITDLAATGFQVDQVWEPQWTAEAAPDGAWGLWSAERCALVPGTLIVAAHKAR